MQCTYQRRRFARLSQSDNASIRRDELRRPARNAMTRVELAVLQQDRSRGTSGQQACGSSTTSWLWVQQSRLTSPQSLIAPEQVCRNREPRKVKTYRNGKLAGTGNHYGWRKGVCTTHGGYSSVAHQRNSTSMFDANDCVLNRSHAIMDGILTNGTYTKGA